MTRPVRIIRGVLLLVAIAVLSPIAVALWPEAQTSYSARFADASGLVPRNDVRINDVIIGRITGVSLDGLDAVVEFETDTDVVIPDESTAQIRQTSLLGEYYLDLRPAGAGRRAACGGPMVGAGRGGASGGGRHPARQRRGYPGDAACQPQNARLHRRAPGRPGGGGAPGQLGGPAPDGSPTWLTP